ncbi:type 1 glutamine amidotransferase [Marinimicrobium sp. ABcell2]|uniref:type 1 glutamine amidotransferase n=1 Tax=Marinimicrobium sp. ABcell2 TaxID=3069751 RepID=UPI0027B65AA2|nr:type 1 glutamine amidotransferase [Marinimicrobium sp. ABcell2]MDQ2075103.1 type 1 glutamine amidotransferase [Marinimicrobium sp. ABcell2]
MTTRVRYLQHVPFEGLGSMLDDFHRRGWSTEATRWYKGESAPELDSFDWLVIMGGPMNVDDETSYPWLKAEKALIHGAIDAGKVVIGICLGAQLIARALGAKVEPMGYKEIGWFPVRRQPAADNSILTSILPDQFDAFHWHGDSFELPPGAQLLLSSEACQNQAFCLDDRVFGFQCHLETTPQLAQAILENCGDELDGSHYVQSPEDISALPAYFAGPNQVLSQVVDAIVASQQKTRRREPVQQS